MDALGASEETNDLEGTNEENETMLKRTSRSSCSAAEEPIA